MEDLTSEIITEEVVEMQQLSLTPHSTDFNSNHLEQQMGDDVINDINAMIQDGDEDGLWSPTCCIYKVPPTIREPKEEAYTPKVASIGPFHYRNEKLIDMERQKRVFFKRFIREAKTDLDDLLAFAKLSEPTVRASYSGNIDLSHNELVKLILVDASFIIELFLMAYTNQSWNADSKLSLPCWEEIIMRDMLLLENQLPFDFLKDLFNRAFPLHIPSFLHLTFFYFGYFNIQNKVPDPSVGISHFTDLLRFFHLPTMKPHDRESFQSAGDHFLLYSANELQEAGIKFKVSESKCLLDLKFSGSVLEIPQIVWEDKTENLFRNMIALEQCHYIYSSYITDYALILDCLINTNKDVDVLTHKKIIRHYLGDSSEVAVIFNGLWKNIIQANLSSEYVDICKRLNNFYQNPWHKMKAALRRDYCKTPWQTLATIAGIILLFLSLIQTIFSVLQVVYIKEVDLKLVLGRFNIMIFLLLAKTKKAWVIMIFEYSSMNFVMIGRVIKLESI